MGSAAARVRDSVHVWNAARVPALEELLLRARCEGGAWHRAHPARHLLHLPSHLCHPRVVGELFCSRTNMATQSSVVAPTEPQWSSTRRTRNKVCTWSLC